MVKQFPDDETHERWSWPRFGLIVLLMAVGWFLWIRGDELICNEDEQLYYTWAPVSGARSYRFAAHPITTDGVVVAPTLRKHSTSAHAGMCLSPGQYRFSVIACNDVDGDACSNETSYRDVLWPPQLPPAVLPLTPPPAVEPQ